jgi:hypothetical protein
VNARPRAERLLPQLGFILDVCPITACTAGNRHHLPLHVDRALKTGMFKDRRTDIMRLRKVA